MTDVLRKLNVELRSDLSWKEILTAMKEVGESGPRPVAITNLLIGNKLSVLEVIEMTDAELLDLEGMGEASINLLNRSIPLAILWFGADSV